MTKNSITIFTPTYNRRKLLERLYTSLLRQSDMDFEWVVVDDGSKDDTEIWIRDLSKTPFKFKYIRTSNRGKHLAINEGVNNASGEWFFIVDSDDYILPNAVEELKKLIKQTPNDISYAGFCTNRIYEDGTLNGNKVEYEILDSDFISYTFKLGYNGEKPPCLKTSVWRDFPFPVFEWERFCSEALVLRRMAKKYKVRYFNKSIYVMEGYLEDGITYSLKKHFLNSPSYAAIMFKEQLTIKESSLRYKIATIYNYWKYYRLTRHHVPEIEPGLTLKIIGWPIFVLCSIVKVIAR